LNPLYYPKNWESVDIMFVTNTESLKLVGQPYPLLHDKVEKIMDKVNKFWMKLLFLSFCMG